MASYPIVEVTWEDAGSFGNSRWADPDTHIERAKQGNTCTTVGYLIHRDQHWLVLAMNRHPESGELADCMQIPTGMRPKIRRLHR